MSCSSRGLYNLHALEIRRNWAFWNIRIFQKTRNPATAEVQMALPPSLFRVLLLTSSWYHRTVWRCFAECGRQVLLVSHLSGRWAGVRACWEHFEIDLVWACWSRWFLKNYSFCLYLTRPAPCWGGGFKCSARAADPQDLFSLILIDVHWFPSISDDGYWLSMVFNDFQWFSLMLIDF